MEQQSPDQLDVSSRVSRSSKRQEGNDIKKEIKTAGDEIVVFLLFRQPPQASGNPKEDFLFFSLSLSFLYLIRSWWHSRTTELSSQQLRMSPRQINGNSRMRRGKRNQNNSEMTHLSSSSAPSPPQNKKTMACYYIFVNVYRFLSLYFSLHSTQFVFLFLLLLLGTRVHIVYRYSNYR